MTRTIPVSGRFTKRQRDVYDAVLRVKNEATKLLVPGAYWKAYHVEVGEIMTAELLGLGLLDKADVQNQTDKNPAYKKYFMHGTSHHLGSTPTTMACSTNPSMPIWSLLWSLVFIFLMRGLAFGWKTMLWYKKQGNR